MQEEIIVHKKNGNLRAFLNVIQIMIHLLKEV